MLGYIIGGLLAYAGLMVWMCGFFAAADRTPDHDAIKPRTFGIAGWVCIIAAALVLLSASGASAQVMLSPGESTRICNTIGSNTGGGVVCTINIRQQRIEMNYANSMHWQNFWGTGDAASVLSGLCRETQALTVFEIIARKSGFRVRSVSCADGRSGPWVLSEPNYSRQQEICEMVQKRSLGRITCSYNEDLASIRFIDRGVLRATNWSGQHDDFLATLCQEANVVRETFPDGSINHHTCIGG